MSYLSNVDFKRYTISEIQKFRNDKKLFINISYQRSKVWKQQQKQALIDSILGNYPIGVLVLWENRKRNFEILDGQQRVETISDFMKNDFPVNEK